MALPSSKYYFEISKYIDISIDNFIGSGTDDLIFYKDIDDYHETHEVYYFLDSHFFQCAVNVDSAYIIALEILDLLNGFAQINSTHIITRPAKIIAAYDENYRVSWNSNYVPNYTWQKVHKIRPKRYSRHYLSGTSFLHVLLHLAKTDMVIYCLLKFSSQPISWMTLYKSFETLESSVERNNDYGCKKNWSKRQSAKYLTMPANKYDIVGLDARHGYHGIDITKDIDPNSAQVALVDARNWLMPFIREHLVWKSKLFLET